MKMKLNTSDFVSAIKILDRINSNGVLPILDSVKVTVNGDKAKLTRTNIERTINVFLPADIEWFGTILLSMKTIDMLKNLKEGYFELTEDEIITEKKRISFKSLAVEEYPELNDQANQFFFELSEPELNKMLEVKYCMSDSETRPILCGVCFDSNRTVAIDGYRMSIRQGSYESNIDKVVVDAKTIDLLDKVLDKKSNNLVRAYGKNLHNNDVQFVKFLFIRDNLNFEVIGNTIPGEYMNYKGIIPQNIETTITVNSGELLPEFEFMYKVSNREAPDIVKLIAKEDKLILDGRITEQVYDRKASREATLKAQHEADLEYYAAMDKYNMAQSGRVKTRGRVRTKKPEQKTIKEIKIYKQQEINRIRSEVFADVRGKEWEAAFNMKYMYEAFKQYDGTELKLKAISNIAPVIITPDDENLELVLPIRIK
jgi:DNA polymerase III sliding clamp (beta) subunit (PCNA family)